MGESWPKLDRPAFGSPCNSCGLCCLREQCPISLGFFGNHPVCPALRQESPRLICGLCVDATPYLSSDLAQHGQLFTDAIRLLLGAGQGCDSGDGDDETRAAMMEKVHAAIAAASPELRAVVATLLDELPEDEAA